MTSYLLDADHSSVRLGSIVAVLLAASSCGVAFDGSEPATTGGPSGSAGVGGAGASGGAAQGGAAQGGGVGGAAQGGGGVGGAAQGGGGMGGSGGAACTDGLEVVAAVADCVKHLMPDPDYCETHVSGSGVGEMDVDESRDSTPGNISRAYLRFDLPPDALGAGAFTLRLVNTGLADADSPGSGAVWQVAPFTRASLFIGPPAPVGGNPLDGDQGSVSLNDVVEWDMPAQVIQGGSVYLSVVGTDDNGVRYWNNNSNAPPKLIVTCGG